MTARTQHASCKESAGWYGKRVRARVTNRAILGAHHEREAAFARVDSFLRYLLHKCVSVGAIDYVRDVGKCDCERGAEQAIRMEADVAAR